MSESVALKRLSPAQKAAGVTTRFLHVSGIDPAALARDCALAALKAVFERYGALEHDNGLVVCAEKRFCWVRYKNVASAIAATDAMSGLPCEAVNGLSLHLSYADAVVPPPAPAVAIAPSDGSGVPGLRVLPDFISVAEEIDLLGGLCSVDNPQWQQGISRRVQHYGFTFAYETLTLQDTAPRFSPECSAIAAQMEALRQIDGCGGDGHYFTQVTINEYLPGQGISSHIDNVDCFGESVYILSIGAGITMLMTENGDPSRSGGRNILDSRLAGNVSREPPQVDAVTAVKHRQCHVWLPSRSLLILEGDARYRWCHGIAPRMNDQLSNGELVKRSRRVSLTFRQATTVDRSKGLVPPVAVASTTTDVALAEKQRRKDETKRNIERKKEKKLLANSERALQRELAGLAIPERIKVPSSLPLSAEAAKDIENDTQAPVGLEHTHVFDVYNQIALHWHHTRGIRKVYWHRVKQFLDELPKGTLLADVGSGDGKYFGINPGVVSIGCDRSEELLGVSWSTEFETLCCDAVQLPYRESTFDAAICIAVMHHLATVPRRLALLREIIRIVTPGGFVVVQAWAQEQGESSKRTFESQDVLVPWQLQSTFSTEKGSTGDSKVEVVQNEGGPELINTIPGNNTTKIYQRYCHVYRKGEIEELCGQIQNCTVVETGWDKGNWFVKLCKRL